MGTAVLCNHGSLYDEHSVVIHLQEAMLDLDTGTTNTKTADIGFGVYGTMRFYGIDEIFNADISIWAMDGLTGEHAPQPSFDQCRDMGHLFSYDNEPEYVCVITNAGHIARVKVEKYNPVQQVPSLEISFITWDKQVEMP